MVNFFYDGYKLETSEQEPHLGDELGCLLDRIFVRDAIRDVCMDNQTLRRVLLSSMFLPPSHDVGEREIPRDGIEQAVLAYERNRAKVLPALRAIVRGTIKGQGVPTGNAVDIGSGAAELRIGALLPTLTQWKTIDTNPQIVANPYGCLSEIVRPNSLDMVSGLSILGRTCSLSAALENISTTLKPGGILFHVQDSLPDSEVIARWVERKGYRSPQRMDITKDGRPYGIHDYVAGYISAAELLRRELGEVINRSSDMSLLLNAWTIARGSPVHNNLGTIYYQGFALTATPQCPLPETLATAVVTIAQKK